MARFAKAAPAQAALKVAIYGAPGSGKTFTALLMAEGLARACGKRIAFVDTERGTDFYTKPVKDRAVHPDGFDFDCIYSRSLAEVLQAIETIDTATYGVVVIDSISHLWDSAIEAFSGKKTSRDTIPMQAWGSIKKPYKRLVNLLMASKLHVFILGRQKNVFEDDGDGGMRKVGVAMKAEGDTPYEPHICLRMEAVRDASKPNAYLNLMHVEKDRSGVLAGKMLTNPSFTTIEPLLSLLGGEQAPAEDEDERMAADSELLQQNDDKAAEKIAKSRDHYHRISAMLLGAVSMEDVGKASAEFKKARRYMTDEHVEAISKLGKSKSDQIAKAAAPEMA